MKVGTAKTISAKDLAAYWGVSYYSIRHGAQQGEIPGAIKDPKKDTWTFDTDIVLKEWVPPQIRNFLQKAGGAGLLADRLAIFNMAVTPEDWTLIVKAAVFQAKHGDRYARKWIADYLMGTPIRRVVTIADVVIHDKTSDARAQAILALLGEVKKREEPEIIDVEVVDAPSGTAG